MFLRELEVDCFRAIRRAKLRLDASTTLTGENGCGMGSLIAALHLVLGRAEDTRVSAADVHRPGATGAPAGDIRIRLVFEERTAGEWRTDWHAPLAAHLAAEAGKRRLVVEASADPPPDGGFAELRVRVPGLDDGAANRSVVRHVRTMNPLLRIQGGMLTAPGRRAAPAATAPTPPAAGGSILELVSRVLGEADELLSGAAPWPERNIEAGAAAAATSLH